MFYRYFFERYRSEYPDKTIVTATFTNERDLDQCVVYEGRGKIVKMPSDCVRVPEYEDALHLYDGPPKVKASGYKMVCFTSPNYAYFSMMRKSANHIPLYMPVWTLDELLAASSALEHYNIDEELLQDRFLLFGGCARYCLVKESDRYDVGVEELQYKIKDIVSFDDIKSCILNKANKQDLSHSIFYYIPVYSSESGLPRKYQLKVGSKKIERMVMAGIVEKNEIARKDFLSIIRSASSACTLLGWMFEYYANMVLGKADPSDFKAFRPLQEESSFALDLEPGAYKPAEKQNQESIDGHCYCAASGVLYLFQTTLRMEHLVNQNGIIELIEENGWTAQVMAGILKVKLVFVVALGMGEQYRRQPIFMRDFSGGMSAPVSNIAGIGKARSNTLLSEYNIKTAQELKDSSTVRPYYMQLVKKYEDDLNAATSWDNIINSKMDQYVLELQEEYTFQQVR